MFMMEFQTGWCIGLMVYAWEQQGYLPADMNKLIGERVYRKQKIGTVRQYPRSADAEKAALVVRAKITRRFGHRKRRMNSSPTTRSTN